MYRDGISFIDQLGAMEGILTLIGLWGGALPLWMVIDYVPRQGIPWSMVALVFVCALMIRADNSKYHYYPVLFDRAAGKIHLFVEVKIPWWKIWQWIPPRRIETWDWAQARAEVVEFAVVTGSSARTEYGLVCAITERPGSANVIARFGVGLTSAYDGGEAMVQRWEHIRRFMCEKGPHLAPGDRLYEDDSTGTLWGALTWGQPLLGPGSMDFWTGRVVNGWWFFTIPGGALMLTFLPFTVTSGLLRWCLHHLRRAPKWPADIIASVGGELLKPAARAKT
jgi:hypothetical protein